jgi:hypothetical protein
MRLPRVIEPCPWRVVAHCPVYPQAPFGAASFRIRIVLSAADGQRTARCRPKGAPARPRTTRPARCKPISRPKATESPYFLPVSSSERECRKMNNMAIVAKAAGHGVSISETFRIWLRIALLSFGGPAGQIAMKPDADFKEAPIQTDIRSDDLRDFGVICNPKEEVPATLISPANPRDTFVSVPTDGGAVRQTLRMAAKSSNKKHSTTFR